MRRQPNPTVRSRVPTNLSGLAQAQDKTSRRRPLLTHRVAATESTNRAFELAHAVSGDAGPPPVVKENAIRVLYRPTGPAAENGLAKNVEASGPNI